ncbi:HET domain protein [Moelleriella libera RCEF 2490]|uniref:HET domain protein n=1 Tax=Moelleriella libera RCEF 2490 TaxID=1081109 RepID=A0A167ZNE9_9HYPO|nr:HET domain protein [Moelleriella libera RCEF 2490]
MSAHPDSVESSTPPAGAPGQCTSEPYASKPLHPTTDSIRTVTIDPCLSPDGLLSCRLQTTTFAGQPRYETLSYRWGDETLKEKIIVDGVLFHVTFNLFEALHYFRRHPRGVPIWIDAISINQSDIPERSGQLRIMPHIYTRAVSTIVWLGGRYIDVPINLMSGDAPPDTVLMRRVVSDGYWDRVWILQEIGKSRKIHLCFGREPVEWNVFIAWIRKHEHDDYYDDDGVDIDDSGPLRLHRLLQNKYDGSCSLRRLLVDHAQARAKDPRDKIYGLVGLATDGRGFPMDYGKTLLDVWADTMHFMSRHGLLPTYEERIRFCQVVRDLLGGETQLGSVSGVVQFHNDESDNDGDDDDGGNNNNDGDDNDDDNAAPTAGLTFLAEVYGVIVSLGPTTTELLSSLCVTDTWERELQRLYRGNLDAAYHESDSLMRRVLDAPDGKIVPLTSFASRRVIFYGPELYGDYWNFMHRHRPRAPGLAGAWVHQQATGAARDEPRLAMLKMSYPHYGNTPFKLAFVSPGARQGDMICRIDSFPLKRIVVRPAEEPRSSDVRMWVCSTAIMVKDVLAPTYFDDAAMRYSFKMNVFVDAHTLYALVFGNEDESELSDKLQNLELDPSARE